MDKKSTTTNQPASNKTIEDYSLFRKEARDVNDQTSPKNQQISNYVVMRDLAKAAGKIGLTPQSFYRAADKQAKGVIKTSDFRTFLGSLQIGLTEAHITKLLFMCEENYSGVVRKEDFYNLLAAFEVEGEKDPQNSRSYSQMCVIQLAKQLDKAQVTPVAIYDSATASTKSALEINQLLQNLKKTSSIEMRDIEVIGAFNHLDVDRSGKIEKNFWVNEISKAGKARENVPTFSLPPHGSETPAFRNTDTKRQSFGAPSPGFSGGNFQSYDSSPVPEVSKHNQSEDQLDWSYQASNTEKKIEEIRDIIQRLKKFGIDIKNVLRDLTKKENLKHQKSGILVPDMLKLFEKYQQANVNQIEVLRLFKAINLRETGSINYPELVRFYTTTSKDIDIDFLFELIAAQFRVQEMDAKLVFKLEGYDENSQLTQENFNDLATQILEIDTSMPDLKQKAWLFFSPDGKQFPAKKCIDQINKFQETLEKKATLSLSLLRSSAKHDKDHPSFQHKLGQEDYDFEYFEKFLAENQPKLEPSDFAVKDFYLEGKQSTDIRWGSILLNQLAVIKYCHQAIREMRNTGKESWIDEEFGSTSQDQFGSKSMYLSDSDIPPGAPDPADCLWISPFEILFRQLENNEPMVEIIFKDKIIEQLEKRMKTGNEDIVALKNQILSELPTNESLFESMQKGIIPPEMQIQFLKGGASSNDVKQSQYLGDCWFISALSLIASDDFLLQGFYDPQLQDQKSLNNQDLLNLKTGVHPPLFRYLRKYGIYVFQFYQKEQWHFVLIDQRLCARENGQIIYAQCTNPTETWVPYIEKALAKLHFNYQALTSGDIGQGLADMTGMVADKTKLMSEQYQADQLIGETKEVDELWESLKADQSQRTMMGCSADGETEGFILVDDINTGIMSGHAYSIIDVFELQYHPETLVEQEKAHQQTGKPIRGFHRMLRIRNPWGYGQWQLKWSQDKDSDGYQQKLKRYIDSKLLDKYYEQEVAKVQKQNQKLKAEGVSVFDLPEKYDPSSQDGSFLMCFKDWRQMFSNLFKCINFPENFRGLKIRSELTPQSNYGPPKKDEKSLVQYATKNPQFIMEVSIKTNIYIFLRQPDGRLFYGEKFPFENVMCYLLLCVYKLEPNEKSLEKFDAQQKIYDSGKLNLRRECDTNLQSYEPGQYSIIPCTKNPGQSQKYSISIYVDVPEGQEISQILKITDRNGKNITTEMINEETDKALNPQDRDNTPMMSFAEQILLNQSKN